MQPITILVVEDNILVRHLMRDTLQLEGWRVVTCVDGFTALKEIESAEYYDAILTDNDLPGVGGIELIQRARSLPHRQLTPIIMLTASLYEAEAQRAGANAFLRKPEDVSAVVETVRNLVATNV